MRTLRCPYLQIVLISFPLIALLNACNAPSPTQPDTAARASFSLIDGRLEGLLTWQDPLNKDFIEQHWTHGRLNGDFKAFHSEGDLFYHAVYTDSSMHVLLGESVQEQTLLPQDLCQAYMDHLKLEVVSHMDTVGSLTFCVLNVPNHALLVQTPDARLQKVRAGWQAQVPAELDSLRIKVVLPFSEVEAVWRTLDLTGNGSRESL